MQKNYRDNAYPALYYIELKTGQADRGPAWITRPQFSRERKTLYFANKALIRNKGGIQGNYVDKESGEEYWVSGVKKNGKDRHWAGGGPIQIDATVVADYLALRHLDQLPKQFHIVTLAPTDTTRFHIHENAPIT
ncbi:MAG: hypothetical protein H6510_12485 [Acidobacteria bacterium]|nr:hypothetical protein [Acidobacteriota bacterium]MCB9398623.1 hypothetical protein [Acidobacteriota bacterium]